MVYYINFIVANILNTRFIVLGELRLWENLCLWRENALWELLKYYGLQMKLVNISKIFYNGMNYRVVQRCEGKTGVRQGYQLYSFLDFIMKKSIRINRKQKEFPQWIQLEDLDFADNFSVLSHNQQQLREKTNRVSKTAQTRLRRNEGKAEILKVNK